MIFSKVKVAEWLPFWERDAQSFTRMFSLYNLVVSHFGFEGGTLILITPVPGHFLLLLLVIETDLTNMS